MTLFHTQRYRRLNVAWFAGDNNGTTLRFATGIRHGQSDKPEQQLFRRLAAEGKATRSCEADVPNAKSLEGCLITGAIFSAVLADG